MINRIRIFNPDLHKEAVAALFGVWVHDVTPAMLSRVRIVGYLLKDPRPTHEVLADQHEYLAAGAALADPNAWPDCPVCKQSATGRYYNGIHGCTRCGWSAGGKKDKRRDIYDN